MRERQRETESQIKIDREKDRQRYKEINCVERSIPDVGFSVPIHFLIIIFESFIWEPYIRYITDVFCRIAPLGTCRVARGFIQVRLIYEAFWRDIEYIAYRKKYAHCCVMLWFSLFIPYFLVGLYQ